MSNLPIPFDRPYRDMGKVAILSNKIAELDQYTNEEPFNTTYEVCFGNTSIKDENTSYITHQLLTIKSLEEELEAELAKQLEPVLDEFGNTIEQKVADRQYASNRVTRNPAIIRDLQRKISAWEKEDEQQMIDKVTWCTTFQVYAVISNALLIKQILEIRLKRELAKPDANGSTHGPPPQYTYNAMAGPSTGFSLSALFSPASNFQSNQELARLRREIARYEQDPKIKEYFKTKGSSAFVYSIYNTTKLQDLKNKLKEELGKPQQNHFRA